MLVGRPRRAVQFFLRLPMQRNHVHRFIQPIENLRPPQCVDIQDQRGLIERMGVVIQRRHRFALHQQLAGLQPQRRSRIGRTAHRMQRAHLRMIAVHARKRMPRIRLDVQRQRFPAPRIRQQQHLLVPEIHTGQRLPLHKQQLLRKTVMPVIHPPAPARTRNFHRAPEPCRAPMLPPHTSRRRGHIVHLEGRCAEMVHRLRHFQRHLRHPGIPPLKQFLQPFPYLFNTAWRNHRQ